MTQDAKQLYDKAVETKYKLTHGIITTDQAREELREYEVLFNELARAIAKEFGAAPRTFNAMAFLR